MELLICLLCKSKEQVNELVNKAIAAGAGTQRKPNNQGFMYVWAVEDLVKQLKQ